MTCLLCLYVMHSSLSRYDGLNALKPCFVGKLAYNALSANYGLGGSNYHARMLSGLTKHAQDY